MAAKIQVSKEIFEALKYLQETNDNEFILGRHVHKDWANEKLRCLNQITIVQLAEALLFGYEKELSPEERAKLALEKFAESSSKTLGDYRQGMIDFANAHKISYVWLNGTGEKTNGAK